MPIDLEEDKAARAVVFGLLAEMQRRGQCPHDTRQGSNVMANSSLEVWSFVRRR